MKISTDDLKSMLARNDAIARRNPGLFDLPAKTHIEPLRAVEPEPVKRRALVRRVPRKEKSGPRFEIVFTVYAVRPCDWDGYNIKNLQDLLAQAGCLPGDAWHQLEGRVRSRCVQAEEEERTEIEITRLT